MVLYSRPRPTLAWFFYGMGDLQMAILQMGACQEAILQNMTMWGCCMCTENKAILYNRSLQAQDKTILCIILLYMGQSGGYFIAEGTVRSLSRLMSSNISTSRYEQNRLFTCRQHKKINKGLRAFQRVILQSLGCMQVMLPVNGLFYKIKTSQETSYQIVISSNTHYILRFYSLFKQSLRQFSYFSTN